jgi:hypothetical protein
VLQGACGIGPVHIPGGQSQMEIDALSRAIALPDELNQSCASRGYQ